MILTYRGGDLELKTPRTWAEGRARGETRAEATEIVPAGPDWLADALEEAEVDGEEVWVDATVLRCCNQAYELAVAHRSPEVRLEHLVHAMTLVPAAIDSLRRDGISDATLRRESGIIIAHDIPSAAASGKFAPSTSDEMEELLRHAAGRAYQLRSPVTIEDLLQTLFDMTRDNPTRSLLSRHRADWSIREPVDPPRRTDYMRERPRPGTGRSRTAEVDLDLPTVTDSYQNGRIDALERAVRDLADLMRGQDGEVAVDPPARTNGNGPASVPPDVLNRLADVEAGVDQRFRELARTWNVLGDRLQAVEDLLLDGGTGTGGASSSEIARLAQSVERLRGLESLPGRLDRLEEVNKKLDNLGKIDEIVTKLDRLDRLDVVDAVERKLSTVEQTFKRVLDRLDALDSRVDARVEGDFDLAPIRQELEGLTRLVKERPVGNGADLGPVLDRFKDMESKVSDASLIVKSLGDRIDAFEGNVDAYRAQLAQTTTTLGTEVKAIASAVSAQHAAGERLHALVSQGLNNLSTLTPGNVDTTAIVAAITQPVQRTLGEIRSLVDADRTEQRDQFEYLVNGLGKSSEDHRHDLSEVHEAMLKLNSNQQTLAQSMDRWRQDVAGNLGLLTSRFEAVETRFNTPVEDERVNGLSAKLDQVANWIERKEKRRSGFLMWLFGTEDWWSDGWRTPEEREAARQAEMPTFRIPDDEANAGENRRIQV